MIPQRLNHLSNLYSTDPEKIASRHETDTNDSRFRKPILERLPSQFAIPIASHYANLYAREGRRIANLYLLDVKDDLSKLIIKLTSSDDEIICVSQKIAERCKRLRNLANQDENAYYAIKQLVYNYYQIDISILGKKLFRLDTNTKGVLNRLCDEHWWRRTIRKVHVRNVEDHAIRSGLVHKNAGIYISDIGFERHQQQQRRNLKMLEHCIAVNQTTGDEFSLLELAEKSLSNPKCRRAELMVRISGFEALSKELGHMAMFYTITCPSKMHAFKTYTNSSGQIIPISNPKYNNTTPHEAQKYLTKLWSQIRAKLKRDGLEYYGFRVTEAHHDGTPHWHLLIFMSPEYEQAISHVIKKYALREDANEDGAAKYRFKAEKINPQKGSATGYIAKYIAKGLDGFGLDVDLYGENAKNSAQRTRAWASTWGIRQFQQLGGPPVTIYRELRRIDGSELKGLIEEVWNACDSGDWHQFVKLMGGPTIERKDNVITISKQWNDKPNRYQEPSGYQIIGVNWGNVVITTRIHQWKIEYKKQVNQNLVIQDVTAISDLEHDSNCEGFNWASRPPWSSVNNCTDMPQSQV